jgi:hypothetical protein
LESLLKEGAVDQLMKLKLSVTSMLPSERDNGVVLAHAIIIFLVVPETGVEDMLALAKAGLKKVAGGGLKDITVESYSILRVIEPMFEKPVTVTCVVKVSPGQIVAFAIVVIGALSE